MNGICLFACALAFPSLVHGQAATLDEIGSAYSRKYEQIQTIRVDLTSTMEPVIAEDLLFRHFNVSPFVAPTEITLAAHRDGRLFHYTVNPWFALDAPFYRQIEAEFPDILSQTDGLHRVPYRRLREIAEAQWRKGLKPSPRIVVYDGGKLWKFSPEEELQATDVSRKAFRIVDPDRASRQNLSRTLLDTLLLSFEIPGLESEREFRDRNRLPDLFSVIDFEVLDDTEAIEGAQCIVVEAPNEERLYFDPAFGFALRKRQWYRDDRLIYEFLGRDFEKLGDDFWLPRSCVYTQYGAKEFANGAYVGKPIHRRLLQINRFELNRPEHLSYFSVDVPAGAWVIDETMPALDEEGNPVPLPKSAGNIVPSVGYIQPADQEDLDRVVREARTRAAKPAFSGSERSRDWGVGRTVLIWFNVGIAAVVLLFLLRRRLAAA